MTDSLLSRLQALTGPDREVDAEIALANGWKPVSAPSGRIIYWRSPDDEQHVEPPRYTESLDAAKQTSGDFPWSVGTDPEGGFGASCLDQWGHSDANDAIALLIAIRKAKEETTSALSGKEE